MPQEIYYALIILIVLAIIYFIFKQNFTQFHVYGAKQRYDTEFSGTNQRVYREGFEQKKEDPNIFKNYMNLLDARSPREESSLFKKLMLENQVI